MHQPIKATVLCHFFNEDFLLPHWLDHHTRLFDNGLMINYRSTDKSVEIIKKMAPHWEIVNTRNDCFRCEDIDKEVMDYENGISGWKMCLNATEFLFIDDLKSKLLNLERERQSIAKFKGFEIIDNPAVDPPFDYDKQLILQRFHAVSTGQRDRIIHKKKNGNYCFGRHQSHFQASEKVPLIKRGFLFRYDSSPYSEQIKRKFKMSKCIPPEDVAIGRGYQHFTQFDEKTIYEGWNRQLPHCFNLLEPTNNNMNCYIIDTLNALQSLYKRDGFVV